MAGGGAEEREMAREVAVEHDAPVGVKVVHAAVAEDACEVHDAVETPILVERVRDEGFGVVEVRGVAGMFHRVAARVADVVGDCVRDGGVVAFAVHARPQVVHDDARARRVRRVSARRPPRYRFRRPRRCRRAPPGGHLSIETRLRHPIIFLPRDRESSINDETDWSRLMTG